MKAILILIGFLVGLLFLAVTAQEQPEQVREGSPEEGRAGFC